MTVLTKNIEMFQKLEKYSRTCLVSCFEDTTGYAPSDWLKDQIINEVVFYFNEEYREDFLANLQDGYLEADDPLEYKMTDRS